MMRTLKQIARKIPGFPFVYHILYNKYVAFQLKLKNTEDVFTDIYRRNKWGGKDSISGPGSDGHQTRVIARECLALFNEFNISTMLDIPCGDFHWMKSVDLKGINYTGADIVKDLIQRNRERYERDSIRFQSLNLIRDNLPKVDLVFCRDCLVHFSFEDICRALHNICESQSEFLLTTTFTDRKDNHDIVTGQWRVLNLEVAPFMLPKPLRTINEECTQGNGLYKDKSLALWRTGDIRERLTKRST
jgi:2-polyprenyl-3-methyl-5-hydroxy-6-metoxy-1,4-benzoquinol methylase